MPEPTTTTVYVPTLIESVEQAEKLPDETVAMRDGYFAREKLEQDCWGDTSGNECGNKAMPGWTALAPVTATVERRSVQENDNGGQSYFNPEAAKDTGLIGAHIATMPVEARYTTPWTPEEAT